MGFVRPIVRNSRPNVPDAMLLRRRATYFEKLGINCRNGFVPACRFTVPVGVVIVSYSFVVSPRMKLFLH